MPGDSKTSTTPPRSKPTTRSSIRQSLNLSSMSKALADVMNKDKETSKPAKKTKDASSRRSSALTSLPSVPAPRASMSDSRPPSQGSIISKRTETPDSKTGHRRRNSALHPVAATASSADESSKATASENQPQTILSGRIATLRPRTANGNSALPKYRPKSVVNEGTKPPSPIPRAGTRRRFSSSDDEKKEQKKPASIVSPAEKQTRPISPLPQRAALKANLTNSVNVTPPATPSKPKSATPSTEPKGSPSRPNKIVKTTFTTRPPSSSSSLSLSHPSHTPKSTTPKGSTLKTSGLKAKLGLSRSATEKGSPLPRVPSPSRNSPSPLSRHVRSKSRSVTTTSSSSGNVGNMSHISEGDSEEDSDADDVALLLAPVAEIGAPTPAMPRIQTSRRRIMPQTPTRLNLPTRANLSYLSPQPPSDNSSLRLGTGQDNTEKAMRGSIMSWEQLANESISLNEDEFGRMLSEIPAPFRSGAASPSLSSQMDVPPSPCLSAIDSPGGYGSISQVLLPDVTPSPAIHNSLYQSRFNITPDASTVDASTATMLRLQLAAAENAAKERLYQIQAMEEELHHVKQSHVQQMEEVQKQMVYMENQWRLHNSEKVIEERVQQERVLREQAIAEAVIRCQEEARQAVLHAIRQESLKNEVLSSARFAAFGWITVRDTCQADLELLSNDRDTLSVLLAQLEQLTQAL